MTDIAVLTSPAINSFSSVLREGGRPVPSLAVRCVKLARVWQKIQTIITFLQYGTTPCMLLNQNFSLYFDKFGVLGRKNKFLFNILSLLS